MNDDDIAVRYSVARDTLKRTEQDIIRTRLSSCEQEIEWLWWSNVVFAIVLCGFIAFHQTK